MTDSVSCCANDRLMVSRNEYVRQLMEQQELDRKYGDKSG